MYDTGPLRIEHANKRPYLFATVYTADYRTVPIELTNFLVQKKTEKLLFSKSRKNTLSKHRYLAFLLNKYRYRGLNIRKDPDPYP